MKTNLFNKNHKGFTLIELLVVIAVLGVLAAITLVAVNPLEQFARGRDASRKTTAGQFGRAMQAYYTSHGATYEAQNSTWVDGLSYAGEVKTVPTGQGYTQGGYSCTTGGTQSNFCYKVDATSGVPSGEAVVYTTMESGLERSKCAAGQNAFFVWSSANGRAGLVCGGAEPTFGSQTFQNPG